MSLDFIRFRLRILFIVFGVTIIIGTFGFIIIEDLSPIDALYFTIVTIATVGDGDIHPGTPAGKLLAIFMIVMGVGTFLSVIAHATDIILNRREKRTKQKKINMVIGVFFSEVGMEFLTHCSDFDPQLDEIRKDQIGIIHIGTNPLLFLQ